MKTIIVFVSFTFAVHSVYLTSPHLHADMKQRILPLAKSTLPRLTPALRQKLDLTQSLVCTIVLEKGSLLWLAGLEIENNFVPFRKVTWYLPPNGHEKKVSAKLLINVQEISYVLSIQFFYGIFLKVNNNSIKKKTALWLKVSSLCGFYFRFHSRH